MNAIDRKIDNGNQEEVVQRGSICYCEQTKQVPYGTMSRRTETYPSVGAYYDARRAGTLSWGKWE